MEAQHLLAVLDADPRPTFLIDRGLLQADDFFRPDRFNIALKASNHVMQYLAGQAQEHQSFGRWASSKESSGTQYHSSEGSVWFLYDVPDKWRVVQKIESNAHANDTASIMTPPAEPLDIELDGPPATIPHESSSFEAARVLFDISPAALDSVKGLRDHLNLIAEYDWSRTSLGAMQQWPDDILQLVHLMLLDPIPQSLFIGDDHICLYNIAYGAFAGDRHPAIMGMPLFEAWQEAVELNISILNQIDRTGAPYIMENFNISIDRNGYLEELFVDWVTMKLRGPGRGYLCFASDETNTRVRDRRKALLIRISESCRGKRDMSSFWKSLLETIGTNSKDFPFALAYSRGVESDNLYHLEGALDCKDPFTVLPAKIDITDEQDKFSSALRSATKQAELTKISTAEGTLPAATSDLSEKRGHGDRCTQGLVLPIRRTGNPSETLGFLIVGSHTRKTFDSYDESFTQYMVRSIGDLASNAYNAEETDRLARIAASTQQTLVQALATSNIEASQMTAKFQRLLKTMEVIDVGIFEFSPEGALLQANEAFFQISSHPRGDDTPAWSWKDTIFEPDLEKAGQMWEHVAAGKQIRWEARFKWPPTGDATLDATRSTEGRWVDILGVPMFDNEGNVSSMSGVILDISEQKTQETEAIRREQEALESKRNQEQSIDAISHELRNPLGAVVHCADAVLASLVDFESLVRHNTPTLPSGLQKQFLEFYESSFDAVNTIISCSTHQRRIVDDVLTWSKLNSKLLQITPSLVKPTALLQDVRNMFEIEAQKNDVSLHVEHDLESPNSIAAEWVMLDPGRLLQVLINLITNSIKFTRQEDVRSVTVTMGMSYSRPSLDRLPIDFVPSDDLCNDIAVCMGGPEWGTREFIYIYFLVEDTGCGLSPEESSRLFSRFAQGSPRTHTKYGGSGLGLFISRELVKLQCGEIGFSSQAGSGSKFGFFIRARRANAPIASKPGTPALRGSRLSSSSNSSHGVPRYSILIVEDNLVNQAVLSKQLRKLGHDVHVASDGIEALQFIRSSPMWLDDTNADLPADTPMNETFPPAASLTPSIPSRRVSTATTSTIGGGIRHQVELSVILMDVEMPRMNGLSCAAEIRQWEKLGRLARHVPIIAVSANARTEQVQQAMDCGMDDAISKPFRIVDLMPKIERLVS